MTATYDAALWIKAKAEEVAQWSEKNLGIPGFAQAVKINVSLKKKRSYGGLRMNRETRKYQPFISINVKYQANSKVFLEYPAVAKNPFIGTVTSDTPEKCLTALIVHEVAHAIDYWTVGKWVKVDNDVDEKIKKMPKGFRPNVDDRHNTKGGHGARWQKIYCLLREEFVNGRVEVTTPKIVVKQAHKRKRPNRMIKTKRLDLGYGRKKTYYYHKEDVVAVGITQKDYDGNWTRLYTATSEGKLLDVVHEMKDARKARAWIKENLI